MNTKSNSTRLQSSSSPLILRKELENIIEKSDPNNNDLFKIDFKEKYPILFWNLIWFFRRIQVSRTIYELLDYHIITFCAAVLAATRPGNDVPVPIFIKKRRNLNLNMNQLYCASIGEHGHR